MICRRLTALFAAAVFALAQAPRSAGSGFGHVEVPPMKTSIYVGSVAMEMPTFERRGEGYESAYVAKVFPFFFYNEQGRVRVEFTDAMLSRLAAGEAVDFTGLARRDDGAERRIEGRATPAAPREGKLKIRVFYSPRVQLIFNTTYRFPESPAPSSP